MTSIKVAYDDETYEATRIKVSSSPTISLFEGVNGDTDTAKFEMIGSSAVLQSADASGAFLQDAINHVEQLPFVQAVTLDSEQDNE